MLRSPARMIAALFALAIASGCEYIPDSMKPTIESVVPRITAIDLEGVALEFDVNVHNPYPVAMKVPRYRFGFSIEGTEFLNNAAASGIEIPANETGTATIPVRIGYAELWETFSQLKDANEASYGLEGAFIVSAYGREFEVPVSYAGKIPVLKLPTIKPTKFTPGALSLRTAKLDVEADISNPNIFDLGLEGLGYELKIGDISVGSLTVSTLQEIASGGTGKLNLGGEVSILEGIRGFFSSPSLDSISIQPSGTIQTPYGPVTLPGGRR